MKGQRTRSLVVCIRNRGFEASLERRKIYDAIRDPDSEKHFLIRVIDESGEDYLYPQSYFRPLDLPAALQSVLRRVG